MAREKWAPPRDLGVEEKKEWRSKRTILVERGDLSAEDDACLLTLERLCRARQLLRLSREERYDATTKKYKLMATGSTGQAVAHPMLAVEAKAEADIASSLDALLMTPKSRKSDTKDDAGAASKAGGGKVPRGAFG